MSKRRTRDSRQFLLEGVELELGVVIEDGQGTVGGGHGMIHHGKREIGAADLAAFGAKPGEGLG